jgi:hypothetical protein
MLVSLAAAALLLLLTLGDDGRGRAQVTSLIDASIVQTCVRDDPAADATVDVNCTRVRNEMNMLFRATPTAGAGQVVRIVMNSPEFAAVFNNRSSGSDPRAPQVDGFSETSVVVSMSELRIRYATRFWMMVPDDYAVWSRDGVTGFGAQLCSPADPRVLTDAQCADNQNQARDTDGNLVPAGAIVPQSKLPTPGCYELRCGDCLTGSFRGGNDRNALNVERFWWAYELMRVYYVKPEPLLEYTVNVTVTAPDGRAEYILLGIQHGLNADPAVGAAYGNTDNSTTDDVNAQPWAAKPDDAVDGRLFQTEAWSANQLVRARLVSQARFGQPPPLHGLLIARDSAVAARRGYHESRENPRALNAANCAIFTRDAAANDSDAAALASSGVALCPVPEHWMYGVNFRDQLRIGTDCCSCLGITQQSWIAVNEHRKRSCWDTHFTCVPGHDIWSTDRGRTPRFLMRETQRFRKRQYCLMCNGQSQCGLSQQAFDALEQRAFAGVFAPGGGNGTGPVACDWATIPDQRPDGGAYLANRQDRIDAVLLQSPPTGLPPMWSNSGRSNMWMYRGQLFYEPPDNVGMSIELVVTADALFSRVIQRIPRIRLEQIDVGAPCTVVAGTDGELWFRIINESPFAATVQIELSFSDPAYKVVGENRIGVGLGPAPADVRKKFLIAVTRAGDVPSPTGGQVTLRAFDSSGEPMPGGTLVVGCREEQKAFAGPSGETADTGEDCIGTMCGVSSFIMGIIFIVLGVAIAIAMVLILKKIVLRTGR